MSKDSSPQNFRFGKKTVSPFENKNTKMSETSAGTNVAILMVSQLTLNLDDMELTDARKAASGSL